MIKKKAKIEKSVLAFSLTRWFAQSIKKGFRPPFSKGGAVEGA
jgi:hypothetical protein